MKRILTITMICLGAGLMGLQAQDNSAAAAAADQQAMQEQYQKLVGKIQDLTDTVELQRQHIDALEKEIQKLRDDMAKVNPDTVTRDEFKNLADSVRELNSNREADKKLILDKISDLAKVAAAAPVAPLRRPDRVDTTPSGGDNTKYEGYWHVIAKGETLSEIVAAYNKQGVKATLSQVIKHPLNAKLDPNRLLVDQKVFIPENK